MPIKIRIETIEDNALLHETELEPGTAFMLPDYDGDVQHVMHIESLTDDFGGKIYRQPGVIEGDAEDEIIDTKPFETLPDEGFVVDTLPIGGTITREITTRGSNTVRMKLQHVGSMTLLCYPDTTYPSDVIAFIKQSKPGQKISDSPNQESIVAEPEELSGEELSGYNPFIISTN